MANPYRDVERTCPACHAALRAFRTRLVCDSCDGIMLPFGDLAAAIHDMTSVVPTFEWASEQPGTRACPACRAPMTTCKLVVHLEAEVERPRPQLDRCDAHGLWFDHEELARVFEKVATKGYGGGGGRKGRLCYSPVQNPGRWSALFPKFGGRGGR